MCVSMFVCERVRVRVCVCVSVRACGCVGKKIGVELYKLGISVCSTTEEMQPKDSKEMRIKVCVCLKNACGCACVCEREIVKVARWLMCCSFHFLLHFLPNNFNWFSFFLIKRK